MRRLILLAALLLADCAADAPTGTAEAACQRQAVQDPAVQTAIENANSPLQEVRVQGVHDQDVATRRAMQRCLAIRSGHPAGGVEPVQGGWLGPPLL